MNNTCKRVMSIVLVFVTIFGIAAGIDAFELNVKAESVTITSCERGDIIEFGWYPQKKVTDEELITALNIADGEWISYGYYSGTKYAYDGQMKPGNYMRYKDVVCGLGKYRGVVFDTYRPRTTGMKSYSYDAYQNERDDTFQDNNGYYCGKVYWFEYEPIKWRVLDPSEGLVLSETILDSQAFNNYNLWDETIYMYYGDPKKTYYANDYENSSIRKWLNEDFYYTAFSPDQQGIIEYTELDNSAYDFSCSIYDSFDTYDKIYILSWNDAKNEDYGFGLYNNAVNGTARQAQGSDYAKCQGLAVCTEGNYVENSSWRLRSAGQYSNYTGCVGYEGNTGSVGHGGYAIFDTHVGVRPALKLNVEFEIVRPGITTTEPSTQAEKLTTFPAVTELSTVKLVETTKLTEKTTWTNDDSIEELTTRTTNPHNDSPDNFVTEVPSTNSVFTTRPLFTEPSTKPTATDPLLTKPAISVEIRKPSQTEIVYGDIIILHADFEGEIPDSAKVKWSSDNNNFSVVETSANGTTCVVTPELSGDTTFVATVVDLDGNILASDTQKMTSKAGFFLKIIAFFKKLFGLTRVIPEAIKNTV